MADTVVVFTSKSVQTILEEGGSSAWKLNRARAWACDYLVCTRNARSGWAQGHENHRSAFLIGRIADILPAPDDPSRRLIVISEYALIDIPNAWPGLHYPVWYSSLSELGIDPSGLSFQPVAAQRSPVARQNVATEGIVSPALTVEDYRRDLAALFGVRPDAVEITIRI